ncbi:MAG TPA: TolC family protein [Kofleriaceae bacterium]|nr:TolC family protein [Kofleriaceae bacterium]
MADVVRLAKVRRPEVVAARARARAAAERPAIVSALDDPEVFSSIDHLPFMGGGADVSFTVEQRFPLSRIRGHRERAAEADARRELAQVDRAGLDVELDAASAFWMLAELRERAKLLDDQRALADQMAAAATARFSTSAGMQADVLRAQLEVDRLAGEQRAIAAELRAAEAMLDTSLARPADAPIPELDLSVSDAEPPAAATVASTAITGRPELRAGSAEIARAEADASAMQSMYAPMAMVRTGPSYTMADGSGWMVMVGVSIPLWRGKLRAGVNEARAMADMASADLDAMRRMIAGQAIAARERVAAARARYLALRDNVVPRARQAIGPTLAAYAASQAPLVSAIEAAQALWEAHRELAMARAELGVAWARLYRMTGETP